MVVVTEVVLVAEMIVRKEELEEGVGSWGNLVQGGGEVCESAKWREIWG
jgi:hypothetical protein